jgi:hypothetical protein
MNDKSNEGPRQPGGWPAWEQQAEQILNGIRERVRRNDEHSAAAFADFLKILDDFLSQLIAWVEQTEPPARDLRKWAGCALAERLQFLSAQQDYWCGKNEGFKKRQAEIGDRRHARSPRSYLGWLAHDYLRKLMAERRFAGMVLSPLPDSGDGSSVAELAGYSEERVSRLQELLALPDFADNPAPWADAVFKRMQQDEQYILNLPQMRERNSRDSRERRRSREVRLYDFKGTIVRAVVRLASKPVGYIRGIRRPA